MDTPDTPKPARRRYSDEEQAKAMALLAANGNDTARTARELDMPEATIRHWRDGYARPPVSALTEQKKAELADDFEALAFQAAGVSAEKVGDLSAYQAALVAGIATDKMLLLRGEATSIHETRDDARLEEFRKRYASRTLSSALEGKQLAQVEPLPIPPHQPDTGPEPAAPPDPTT